VTASRQRCRNFVGAVSFLFSVAILALVVNVGAQLIGA